jgi:excisionase family DNA binding protein
MDQELLTTREVQSLVRLNRVTIYRLIRDGEFPAIKIGGQWRFPRKAIEAWLIRQSSPQQTDCSHETGSVLPPPALNEIFTSFELKPVLKAFAEATGLSVFVMDNDGDLLTDCMECNPFCRAIQRNPAGQQECLEIRRQPAGTDVEMLSCHAGLNYLTATITLSGEPAARVVMGPFVTDETHFQAMEQMLPALASRYEADPIHLWNDLHTVQQIGPEQARLLGRLLSRVISVITQLAYERSTVTQRLHQIGQLVDLENVSGT